MNEQVKNLADLYAQTDDVCRSLAERKEAAAREVLQLTEAAKQAEAQRYHLGQLLHSLPGGAEALAEVAGEGQRKPAREKPPAPARPKESPAKPADSFSYQPVPTAQPVKDSADKPAKSKAP